MNYPEINEYEENSDNYELETDSENNVKGTPFKIPNNMPDNIPKDFKKKITKWIKYDNELKESMDLIKTIKDKKKEIEIDLEEFMKKSDIECINVEEQQVEYVSRYRQPPINNDTLLKSLSKLFDRERAKMIINHIMTWRKNNKIETKKKLKRKNK